MDQTDKDRIIQRYDARLARYGCSIETLASGSVQHQRMRHQVLVEVGVTSGSALLDLGCGFGDLYDYLCEHDLQVQYTGYDIHPKLIELAREKHPQAEFQCKDIQISAFPEFDFIVSSSAFNLQLSANENYPFIDEIMNICYAHARQGVAIDFLSSYVDYETSEAFHYNPERIFSMAKKITKRVCLRHDYPLYEFCIYLYPDFKGWRGADATAKGLRHV